MALKSDRQQLLPLLEKQDAMTDTDTHEVYRIVQESAGIEEAKKLAADYTKKALQAIQKLPETKDETKTYLYQITAQILGRSNWSNERTPKSMVAAKSDHAFLVEQGNPSWTHFSLGKH